MSLFSFGVTKSKTPLADAGALNRPVRPSALARAITEISQSDPSPKKGTETKPEVVILLDDDDDNNAVILSKGTASVSDVQGIVREHVSSGPTTPGARGAVPRTLPRSRTDPGQLRNDAASPIPKTPAIAGRGKTPSSASTPQQPRPLVSDPSPPNSVHPQQPGHHRQHSHHRGFYNGQRGWPRRPDAAREAAGDEGGDDFAKDAGGGKEANTREWASRYASLASEFLARDAHLVDAGERALLEAHSKLSEDAMALWVALSQRRGPWFRVDSIASHYSYLQVQPSVEELSAAGLASPAIPVAKALLLLKREQVADLVKELRGPASVARLAPSDQPEPGTKTGETVGISSARKDELVGALLDLHADQL